MLNQKTTSNTLQRGAVSLSMVLTIALIVVGVYLVFKVNAFEERVKSLETKLESAQAGQNPETPVDEKKVKALFTKGNVIMGDANKAKNLVVEFSDPSCPFCHVAAGIDQTIGESMDPQGKRFVWKENGGTYEAPVTALRKLAKEGKIAFVQLYANGHGAGEIAAQALYCANDEGKYWEAHDLLYSKEGYDVINTEVQNDKSKAPRMAEFLAGVTDSKKMESCLTSGKYAKKIADDMKLAQDMGFSGTPMFVINGKKFPGAYSFADMASAIK
ncbi:MAG: DsbA family protein [Patescibacteria group bacterium]